MKFSMNDYFEAVMADCIENGAWYNMPWWESFKAMGFTSYHYDENNDRCPHYLSDEEFLIFVLKYGA